jgi:ketosteroid isomerase-like protein
MSRQNMETVLNAFQSFGEKGIDAALSFFSPDVVWYPNDRWLDGLAYRGHGGLRSLAAAFSENFDDFPLTVVGLRLPDGLLTNDAPQTWTVACREEGHCRRIRR